VRSKGKKGKGGKFSGFGTGKKISPSKNLGLVSAERKRGRKKNQKFGRDLDNAGQVLQNRAGWGEI